MSVLRLFAAVPLSAEVARNLSEPLARATVQAPGIKWVHPSSMHITVKFFGDTPEERLPELIGLMAGAAAPRSEFEVIVEGIGAFPSMARPRVIWAGVTEGADDLCELAGRVQAVTAAAGFGEPDAASFSPHVTLGRVRREATDIAMPPALAASVGREWGAIRVASVTLYSSALRPQGPVYRPLAQAALRRP